MHQDDRKKERIKQSVVCNESVSHTKQKKKKILRGKIVFLVIKSKRTLTMISISI